MGLAAGGAVGAGGGDLRRHCGRPLRFDVAAIGKTPRVFRGAAPPPNLVAGQAASRGSQDALKGKPLGTQKGG